MSFKNTSLLVMALLIVGLSGCAKKSDNLTPAETGVDNPPAVSTKAAEPPKSGIDQPGGDANLPPNQKGEAAAQKQGEEGPVSKTTAGSTGTAKLADTPVTVKKGEVDPYTATHDRKNFIGKHPVAKDQSVTDRVDKSND